MANGVAVCGGPCVAEFEQAPGRRWAQLRVVLQLANSGELKQDGAHAGAIHSPVTPDAEA